MFKDREEIARKRCKFRRCLYGQEYPRAVLKDRRKKGMLFKIVGYDDIAALCEKAKKLHEVHSYSERPAPSSQRIDPHALIPAMSARVRHDHLKNPVGHLALSMGESKSTSGLGDASAARSRCGRGS